MRLLARLAESSILAASILVLSTGLSAYAASGDTVADHVVGQPDFTHNTSNNGGVSASSLGGPLLGVAIDSSGRLWVADEVNSRVVEYDTPLTSGAANRVFGQPDFSSNAANNGGVSASSLNAPSGLAVDAAGRLWVADYVNHRVLEYDSPLTSRMATRVFGQPDFTSNTANNGGLSAASLDQPSGVALDSGGRLYVTDSMNNRMLEYDSPMTSRTATHVFGQPDFTSNTANNGGVSAASLYFPLGVTVDGSGRLWVADFFNSRVLEYATPLTDSTANHVVGQPDFATHACNSGGLSAASLCEVSGVALDGAGHLWVAEFSNQRALEYDNPLSSPSATRVFGQPNFTSNVANNGGVSAGSLDAPSGLTMDVSRNLWVADFGNARVLEYDNPLGAPPSVGGIAEEPDVAALRNHSGELTDRGIAYTLGGVAFGSIALAAAAGLRAGRRRIRGAQGRSGEDD